MAGGVVAALAAQGLAGKVPVSGQDGDAAALNRVALGTQTVDVWKDARELGKAAGEAAVQLCKDKDITKVAGTGAFKSPGGNDMTSILLTPSRSPRTTSTSSSMRGGSTRPRSARTCRPAPSRLVRNESQTVVLDAPCARGSTTAQGARSFGTSQMRRVDDCSSRRP